MEIEVRLTTLDRLQEALALPATTISVGNEGCPHKLPDLASLKEAAAEIRSKGKRFAFVAPVAYESFVDDLQTKIAGLLHAGPIDLVVNDFGLMLGLGEHPSPNLRRVAVGQGLSYSYEQQPWVQLTLQKEPPEVRQALLKNSLDDPCVWPVLRDAGVRWIQMSALAGELNSLESLRTAGFQVSTVLDTVPVAFSRSCHTARHHGVMPPDCKSLCDQPFELRTTHRWRLFHNQLEPMSSSAKRQVPAFSVFGNVTYRRVDAPEKILADAVVFDMRFYAPGALEARLNEVLGPAAAA